jgi:hypothetical protein
MIYVNMTGKVNNNGGIKKTHRNLRLKSYLPNLPMMSVVVGEAEEYQFIFSNHIV